VISEFREIQYIFCYFTFSSVFYKPSFQNSEEKVAGNVSGRKEEEGKKKMVDIYLHILPQLVSIDWKIALLLTFGPVTATTD
jgi:hypothetical protein